MKKVPDDVVVRVCWQVHEVLEIVTWTLLGLGAFMLVVGLLVLIWVAFLTDGSPPKLVQLLPLTGLSIIPVAGLAGLLAKLTYDRATR